MAETLFDLELNLTLEQRAYLAGFFDGEGSVGAGHYLETDDWQAYMSVSNTDLQPLKLFKSAFGGRIAPSNSKTLPEGWKQVYQWHLHGNSITWALKAILPYLTVKRERALKVIEFLSIPRLCKARKGVIGLELRKLNRRGPM